MLGDSPDLNSEDGEGSGYGGLHTTNQVALNEEKKWVVEEAYVDTVCVV